MARFLRVDDIEFTDQNGKTMIIKDWRVISQVATAFQIDIKEGDLLDEVASREEVFGTFGENRSYQLFDQNAVEIVENGFDLSKLKKLRVPV